MSLTKYVEAKCGDLHNQMQANENKRVRMEETRSNIILCKEFSKRRQIVIVFI